MIKGKLNILIDGQWGSTGKGKFAGYLALTTPNLTAVVNNNMPNAGHTYVFDDGRKIMLQQLPIGCINPNVTIFLSAACGINFELLVKEIKMLEHDFGIPITERLFVDYNAMVITEEHANMEKQSLWTISSTMKGCGYALAGKIKRDGSTRIIDNFLGDENYIDVMSKFSVCNVSNSLIQILNDGGTVLGESSQGFDLSLNHGTLYPYTTSRDVTVMSFLNDCGVPPFYLGDVYGVIRTYPIRVGNYKDNDKEGYSGSYYNDQIELSWEDISSRKGYAITEKTTVTGRTRRVFTFSESQYVRFLKINRPTKILVNFANYLEGISYGCKDWNDVGGSATYDNSWLQFANMLKNCHVISNVPCSVYLVGTGDRHSHILK